MLVHLLCCWSWQGLVLDEKYLSALQVLLGKVIDIAEGEYDGTTRQVCLSLCLSLMIYGYAIICDTPVVSARLV